MRLFLVLCLGFCSIADSVENAFCVCHTEGSGLGYSIGYSSLGIFLAAPCINHRVVPFVDLRGHIFNNGKYAANAGAGVRFLTDRFAPAFGINAFYDYLQTKRKVYREVGFGLELLGKQWDVTVNGYFPIGSKKTNIYQFSYDFEPSFLLKAREQLAMEGFDSLARYCFCITPSLKASIGAGPYFYWGTSAKTVNAFEPKRKSAYGGQLQACFSFMKYAFLEGIGSYDSEFKWNGQVKIALCFSFNSCGHFVKRKEIIVVDTISRFSTDPNVLDPEHKPL